MLFQDEGGQNPEKREQMERLVREELERWDSEGSMSQAGRAQSGRASAQRSRPGSSASQRGSNATSLGVCDMLNEQNYKRMVVF